MSRLPIRARVTLVFAGAMAILLAGLGLFIYLRYESQLDEAIDQGLRSRADEIGAIVGAQGPSALADPDADRLVESEETFTQLVAPSGRILGSSAQLDGRPVLDREQLAGAAGGPISFDAPAPPGIEGDVRVVATPAAGERGSAVLVVGTSLDDRTEALGNLAALLLVGGPIALLLASLAGYLSIGAALRPVEEMRRRAAAISAAAPGDRLPVPAADDEIHRLGETLNEMLARLELAIERERTFVDDASHELRTPLALLKTELELVQRYSVDPEDFKAAVDSARVEVDRLIELAEALLVVARSDEGDLALDVAPVDVAGLLGEMAERFRPGFVAAGRSIEVEADPELVVGADRLRIEQALTNLIENARRHGDGAVTLQASAAGGAVELHVLDRGSGFEESFLPSAFERFSRADAGRTGAGNGFGLTIVKAIASAHGGSAGARNRPGGGADVWIAIPRKHP